jgi:hypothetical protein
MTLEVWTPEGIDDEYTITVSSSRYELKSWPYKWFVVEVYNQGPDDVKVMTNVGSLPTAITLGNRETRKFGTEKKPTIWRVEICADIGKTATVAVTTSR